MKRTMLWLALLLGIGLLTACEPEKPEGGGSLPEDGEALVSQFVEEERGDESGGHIVYIKDVASPAEGGSWWCVNVRYITGRGVIIAPLLVGQTGAGWELNNGPDQAQYEAYGCQWPRNPQ